MIISVSGKIGSGKDTLARLLQYWASPHIYGEIKLSHYLKKCETCDNMSPIQIKKFAAKVKEIVALLLGCTIQDLENEEFKNKILPEEWDKFAVGNSGNILNSVGYFSTVMQAEEYLDDHGYLELEVMRIQMTPRLLMQLTGNDFGRDMVHPDIWVNALFSEYKEGCKCKGLCEAEEPLDKNCRSTKMPKWIITDNRYVNEVKAIEKRQGLTIRIERKVEHIYPELWKNYKKTPYFNDTEYGFSAMA